MPECSLCSSVIILLRASFGTTILALCFVMSRVPPSCSEMESVQSRLVYSCKGELSSGVACFPVCSSSAPAFTYALSSAASVMMSRAELLEILRQFFVSSMSLVSSSSSAAEKKMGKRDSLAAM